MEKRQGIVIRTADYREKDRLLVLFTPCGVVTVTARGVRSAESKLKACASVMTFGEFTFGGRNGNAVLTGGEITDNFFSVWTDLKKTAAILTCFELTEKCFSREDDSAEEFLCLMRTVNEIAYGQTAPMPSALKYAIFCAERTGVDYTGIREYDSGSFELLSAFSVADAEEIGTLGFTEQQVQKAFLILHGVFADYLGIKLKSLKAMLY